MLFKKGKVSERIELKEANLKFDELEKQKKIEYRKDNKPSTDFYYLHTVIILKEVT